MSGVSLPRAQPRLGLEGNLATLTYPVLPLLRMQCRNVKRFRGGPTKAMNLVANLPNATEAAGDLTVYWA
jgi:hypothetical protein